MKTQLLGILLTLIVAAGNAASEKPNIVFVLTDDQRWDALSVVQREMGEKGRFPWLQTPNMDRIAADGVRFRNAFVTMPLCAPSRAVFMSGRYNHANGIANNHTPFPGGDTTVQNLLSKAGYATGYFGKWHMNGQRGQRPGFTYSASFIGQGRYWDCPFEINGETTQSKGWVDDVTTTFTIDWIHQQKEKPFFAMVGYKAPHGRHQPPERAKDRFAGEQARRVPNLEVRAIYREGQAETTVTRKQAPAPGSNLPHFRSLSAADDSLGNLLDAIEQLGLKEKTVVVFAGDNGYYHGEHNLGDKRSLYDESLRIPFLWSWPGKFARGSTNDEMVLNNDFAPTVLELAGVAVPKQMQGRSMVSLLMGKKADWRKSFLSEYFYENNFPTTPDTVAVRTADAKLIKYPGHYAWTELFDLKQDPFEMKNLVNDSNSKPLLKRMQSEFDQQVKATGYEIPDYADTMTTNTVTGPKPQKKAERPGKKRRN